MIPDTMFYADGNVLLHLRDGSVKMNHSFEPSSQMIKGNEKDVRKIKSVALRDIKAGEELT
jgi:SET domain-containing protein